MPLDYQKKWKSNRFAFQNTVKPWRLCSLNSLIMNKFEFAVMELLLVNVDIKLKVKFQMMSETLLDDATSSYWGKQEHLSLCHQCCLVQLCFSDRRSQQHGCFTLLTAQMQVLHLSVQKKFPSPVTLRRIAWTALFVLLLVGNQQRLCWNQQE